MMTRMMRIVPSDIAFSQGGTESAAPPKRKHIPAFGSSEGTRRGLERSGVSHFTLSPCGRGWLRCEASKTGERFSPRMETPHPARTSHSRCKHRRPIREERRPKAAYGHLLPQGEKGRIPTNIVDVYFGCRFSAPELMQ